MKPGSMLYAPPPAAGQQGWMDDAERQRLDEEERIKARHEEKIRARLANKRAPSQWKAAHHNTNTPETASSPSPPPPNSPLAQSELPTPVSFSPTTQRILRRAATTPQHNPKRGSSSSPATSTRAATQQAPEHGLAPHAPTLPSSSSPSSQHKHQLPQSPLLSDLMDDSELALRIFMGIHGLCLDEEDVFSAATAVASTSPASLASGSQAHPLHLVSNTGSSASIASMASSSCYSSDSESVVSHTHMFASDCSDAYASSFEETSPRKNMPALASTSQETLDLCAMQITHPDQTEEQDHTLLHKQEQQQAQLAPQKPPKLSSTSSQTPSPSTSSSAAPSPRCSNPASPTPSESGGAPSAAAKGSGPNEKPSANPSPRVLSFRPQRLIRKDLEAGIQDIDKKLDILESEINVLKAKADRALQRENLASFWVQVDELRTHQELLQNERETLLERLDEIAQEEEEDEAAARNRELVPERWRNRAKRFATRRKGHGSDATCDNFSTAGSRSVSPIHQNENLRYLGSSEELFSSPSPIAEEEPRYSSESAASASSVIPTSEPMSGRKDKSRTPTRRGFFKPASIVEESMSSSTSKESSQQQQQQQVEDASAGLAPKSRPPKIESSC